MRRFWVLVYAASIALVACSTQDENYYQLHPQDLQLALKNCQAKQVTELNCEQLRLIATGVNELAYQLQANPQAFGKKILLLQQNLAKQRSTLLTSSNQIELKKTIAENQQELAQRLAIVRWLESPES